METPPRQSETRESNDMIGSACVIEEVHKKTIGIGRRKRRAAEIDVQSTTKRSSKRLKFEELTKTSQTHHLQQCKLEDFPEKSSTRVVPERPRKITKKSEMNASVFWGKMTVFIASVSLLWFVTRKHQQTY